MAKKARTKRKPAKKKRAVGRPKVRDDEWLCSLAAFGRLLRQTAEAAQKWKDKPGFPSIAKNRQYDARDLLEWWLNWKFPGGAKTGPGSAAKTEKYELECRKLEQEIRAKQLANDAQEEGLLNADETFREVTEWATRIRKRLMGLPARIAAIAPGEMKAVLKQAADDEVRACLLEAYTAEVIGTTVEEMIIAEAARINGQSSTN